MLGMHGLCKLGGLGRPNAEIKIGSQLFWKTSIVIPTNCPERNGVNGPIFSNRIGAIVTTKHSKFVQPTAQYGFELGPTHIRKLA